MLLYFRPPRRGSLQRRRADTGPHSAHRAGIAQAESMGAALSHHFGPNSDIDIWASPACRTVQTVAIVAEHLGGDFFAVKTDPRLLEIDVGRREVDIIRRFGRA